MRTLNIVFLACLVQWAAAGRILQQQRVPILRGTNQQETPEYNRYGGNGLGDELLQNVVQSQTQAGVTDSALTTVVNTRNAGQQNGDSRQGLGLIEAQGIVGNAASSGGFQNAPKEAFGSIQYQIHGQGLSVPTDVRTQLANNDAQRGIQVNLDSGNAFRATRAGSDNAYAIVYGDTTHKWTD